jgi:hypothetical protein
MRYRYCKMSASHYDVVHILWACWVPVYCHQQVQIADQQQSPPRYLRSTQACKQERYPSRGSNRSHPLERDPTLVGRHCSFPRPRQQGNPQTQKISLKMSHGVLPMCIRSPTGQSATNAWSITSPLLQPHRHTALADFRILFHGHARDHNPSKSIETRLLTDCVHGVILLSLSTASLQYKWHDVTWY